MASGETACIFSPIEDVLERVGDIGRWAIRCVDTEKPKPNAVDEDLASSTSQPSSSLTTLVHQGVVRHFSGGFATSVRLNQQTPPIKTHSQITESIRPTGFEAILRGVTVPGRQSEHQPEGHGTARKPKTTPNSNQIQEGSGSRGTRLALERDGDST
jgi:hypothetical protein